MSTLHKLQQASSLHDLAAILNYSPSSLAYLIYKKPVKYKQFEIPKSNGSPRVINAPCDELKALQRKIKLLLDKCLDAIEQAQGVRGSISHGFRRGHSIVSNADVHKRRTYVFNVDLEGFFDSIHIGRIRGFLITNNDFRLHPNVATVLAQIICHDDKLPQGSPTSPLASNLIGHLLDLRLIQLAKKTGCSYSRYADDLTFSSNKSEFPAEVSYKIDDGHTWIPGSSLLKVIYKCGFKLNHNKTRMQYARGRQSVTGLTVNQTPNTSAELRRAVRAMTHSLFLDGQYHTIKQPGDNDDSEKITKSYTQLAPLEGYFSYIYMVDNFNRKKIIENSSTKMENIPKTALENLHGDFLFYRYFYANSKPTIVCEGKTDNIYLTCAIKSLMGSFPRLCKSNKEGKANLKVRFINYSELTHRMLGLNGGSADLAALIRAYAKKCAPYKAHPPLHPTIIVVDNDAGSDPIFRAIKDTTGNRYAIPKGKGTVLDQSKTLYYIAQNLYVVLTPLKKDGGPTMMENFFTTKLLASRWEGKEFEVFNKNSPSGTYSKQIFAQRIVKSDQANIDFRKFKPILSSITEAIRHYPAIKVPKK
ncbi:ribonuclease H [Pseudomonas fragi]|uniref:retron Ec67 family RNA-directed DNA polymerase/endonuclease n=1 Tax=Pseudomonas fragi TaxID=296 RepID=UPI000A29FB2F|nr:retron Ec67 family RNA-directed DNA polymerase/endonuclease [Pseudomonas fragi]ARQ73090.1 ribonuclease H [Pseudomonas fragi]